MNIALDAMGGDFAPKATLEGAFLAKQTYGNDVAITLIGHQEIINSHLADLGIDAGLFQVVHAPTVINMGEHPAKAFQQKQDSSIAVGFGMLMKQKADVFCSAGNTGAMLVGSMFTIKPIPGILRPGIAGFLPKQNGEFGIILDVGANADCKPEYMEQFAVIGSLYSKYAYGKSNPTVALMNLGEEPEKGNALSLAVHQLLKANTSINFVGNVEGRDVFNSKYDVIVCDGFSGNVILKMAESIYDLMELKNIKSDFIDLFNYAAVGGSPILGVNGNVIIGHGISTPIAIKNMIEQGRILAQSKVCEKIRDTYKQ